jgi:hypothetical protein
MASTEAKVPLIAKHEAILADCRLELQHAQWDSETVPVTQKEKMHLVVEVTEEPECYPSSYVCVMASFRIVEYILPRPEYCDTEPYPGDPDEIVWRPDQPNVETNLQVGDIVEVYGECWLDLGIYPAVSIPPDAPYFLKKAENLKAVYLPLVLNSQP